MQRRSCSLLSTWTHRTRLTRARRAPPDCEIPHTGELTSAKLVCCLIGCVLSLSSATNEQT